jgi:hypothetical protein
MRQPYKKRSKKRGPVVSKKVTYNGINFASGLERYMYMALKKANIKANTKAKLLFYLMVFILKTKSMKDKPIAKVNIKIEVAKEYFLLNTLLILLVMIL